eukprot:gene30842-38653_t
MVSEVCAGTMTWGSFNDKEEQAFEQMDKLIELGVNFFDTAELYPVAFNYGQTTEMWMGNWLEKRVAEGKVLAIKQLLDKGLIKHWGLSNENAYGITMFCITCDRLGVPRPVSCQNDFSLVDRIYESDTAEAAYRFGVVGLPYGPLAGGVLTGKYFDKSKYSKADADRPVEECRMRKTPEFQPRYGFPAAMQATEKYMALAEKYGLTPTELALAWANSRPFNCSIIIGTTTVRQVEECVNAFKIELP